MCHLRGLYGLNWHAGPVGPQIYPFSMYYALMVQKQVIIPQVDYCKKHTDMDKCFDLFWDPYTARLRTFEPREFF